MNLAAITSRQLINRMVAIDFLKETILLSWETEPSTLPFWINSLYLGSRYP
jgi:hypothetical protein